MSACWNCRSENEPIRSALTGIEYCPDCFQAVKKNGQLSALFEVVEETAEERRKA